MRCHFAESSPLILTSIADMTIDDVRKYESHLQQETTRRVVDGINLDEANQTT